MGELTQDRFSRQVLLPEIGPRGQERIAAARVAVLGCGATGGAVAMQLARAGVGTLRLVDRDLVELSNLPRQVTFTEADAAPGRPKAIAAADALAAIDSSLRLEPHVVDIRHDNIRELVAGCDLVIDGSDSFQLRYLVNDACIEAGIPWVYTGAVGVIGQTMTIVPGHSPCLACWLPVPPPAHEVARCDTAGVLGAAVATVGGMAAAAALRVLVGAPDTGAGRMTTADVWAGRYGSLPVRRRPDCRACVQLDFCFLRGEGGGTAVRMCGRDAVQISAPAVAPDLQEVARMLEDRGVRGVRVTPHLLTVTRPPCTLHLFRDGRAIVEGTSELQTARELLQELVGM